MFKVIETAGHDEPWWFFEDWEKMIVSTEEFDEIEEALCAYQALYQNFEDNYPEKREKGSCCVAFWNTVETDYCVPCECDLQIFHGIMTWLNKQRKKRREVKILKTQIPYYL